MRPPRSAALALGALSLIMACAAPPDPAQPSPVGTPPAPIGQAIAAPEAPPKPAPSPKPTPTPATPSTPEPSPNAEAPCPNGMQYVSADYCTRLIHTCKRKGLSKPRHQPKCLEYNTTPICGGPTRHQRFCIDRYEYPNQKGAHPPVMVNAWDAAALCHKQGKRLCWDSEWTIACEGPQKLPYPYGHTRDASACNIDRPYIPPSERTLKGDDIPASHAELRRLDQGEPSGTRPGCKSGYDVYDLTGNFSEWVFMERRTGFARRAIARGKTSWAATKGGQWVPVRNACRPLGIAHPESWTWYPLSLRCCADPDPKHTPAPPPDSAPLWTPPAPPDHSRYRARFYNDGWTPDTPDTIELGPKRREIAEDAP